MNVVRASAKLRKSTEVYLAWTRALPSCRPGFPSLQRRISREGEVLFTKSVVILSYGIGTDSRYIFGRVRGIRRGHRDQSKAGRDRARTHDPLWGRPVPGNCCRSSHRRAPHFIMDRGTPGRPIRVLKHFPKARLRLSAFPIAAGGPKALSSDVFGETHEAIHILARVGICR